MTVSKLTLVEAELIGKEGDGYIMTHSGRWVNVLDPSPKDIDIRDIAYHLSNQCRFTGAVDPPYTVAQHSVYVSQICEPEDQGWALLHDGSEAYLSDIARPIKKHPDFGRFYLKAETKLTEAIMDHFGLDPYVMPDSVKEADNLMLHTEARDLMPPGWRLYPGAPLGDAAEWSIVPWSSKQSHGEFMLRFLELF